MVAVYMVALMVGTLTMVVGVVCASRARTNNMLVVRMDTMDGMACVYPMGMEYPGYAAYVGYGAYYKVEYMDGTHYVYQAPNMEALRAYLAPPPVVPTLTLDMVDY